jgi:hypothetical protein
MASMTVEGFGVSRLLTVTVAELEERLSRYRRMLTC